MNDTELFAKSALLFAKAVEVQAENQLAKAIGREPAYHCVDPSMMIAIEEEIIRREGFVGKEATSADTSSTTIITTEALSRLHLVERAAYDYLKLGLHDAGCVRWYSGQSPHCTCAWMVLKKALETPV